MTKVSSVPSETATGGRQPVKVWWSSFLGSTIEFYDFNIYSTASALVFVHVFFSQVEPGIGLILSFATLAIGYVARPIGALVFGHFGDIVGRKKILVASIVLMGVATAAIGLVPSFEAIGVWAPILLVVLRLFQGISAGGEWGGGVVMTTEHSSSKWRTFMGSATIMGSSAGYLLGASAWAITIPLTGDNFLTWGWRIPFLATAVLFIIALYIRFKVAESPIMAEAKVAVETGAVKTVVPSKLVFSKYGGRVVIGALIFAGPLILQTLSATFFLSYSVSEFGMTQQQMVTALTIGVAVSTVGIPLAGLIADRIGKRKTLLIGIIGALVNSFLLLPLLSSGVFELIALEFAILMVFHSFCIAPLGALYSELFPTNVRFTGVAVTYQFAALIGGLSPLVAQSLLGAGVPVVGLVGGVSAFLVLGIIMTLVMPKSDTLDLRTV
jgi:MHS family shikimate/dehydroshikimate transporter-like MFS transporter